MSAAPDCAGTFSGSEALPPPQAASSAVISAAPKAMNRVRQKMAAADLMQGLVWDMVFSIWLFE